MQRVDIPFTSFLCLFLGLLSMEQVQASDFSVIKVTQIDNCGRIGKIVPGIEYGYIYILTEDGDVLPVNELYMVAERSGNPLCSGIGYTPLLEKRHDGILYCREGRVHAGFKEIMMDADDRGRVLRIFHPELKRLSGNFVIEDVSEDGDAVLDIDAGEIHGLCPDGRENGLLFMLYEDSKRSRCIPDLNRISFDRAAGRVVDIATTDSGDYLYALHDGEKLRVSVVDISKGIKERRKGTTFFEEADGTFNVQVGLLEPPIMGTSPLKYKAIEVLSDEKLLVAGEGKEGIVISQIDVKGKRPLSDRPYLKLSDAGEEILLFDLDTEHKRGVIVTLSSRKRSLRTTLFTLLAEEGRITERGIEEIPSFFKIEEVRRGGVDFDLQSMIGVVRRGCWRFYPDGEKEAGNVGIDDCSFIEVQAGKRFFISLDESGEMFLSKKRGDAIQKGFRTGLKATPTASFFNQREGVLCVAFERDGKMGLLIVQDMERLKRIETPLYSWTATFIESPKRRGGEYERVSCIGEGGRRKTSLESLYRNIKKNFELFEKIKTEVEPSPVWTVSVIPSFMDKISECLESEDVEDARVAIETLRLLKKMEARGYEFGILYHDNPLDYCRRRDNDCYRKKYLEAMLSSFDLRGVGCRTCSESERARLKKGNLNLRIEHATGNFVDYSLFERGYNWVEETGKVDSDPLTPGPQFFRYYFFASGMAYPGVRTMNDSRAKEEAPFEFSRRRHPFIMKDSKRWFMDGNGSGPGSLLYMPGNSISFWWIRAIKKKGPLMGRVLAMNLHKDSGMPSRFGQEDINLLLINLQRYLTNGDDQAIKTWYFHLPDISKFTFERRIEMRGKGGLFIDSDAYIGGDSFLPSGSIRFSGRDSGKEVCFEKEDGTETRCHFIENVSKGYAILDEKDLSEGKTDAEWSLVIMTEERLINLYKEINRRFSEGLLVWKPPSSIYEEWLKKEKRRGR